MAARTDNKLYTDNSFYLDSLPKRIADYESTPANEVPYARDGWDDKRLNLSPAEHAVFSKTPLLEDQKRAIISLFNNQDTIWHARTGCGKTTTMMWMLLHQLLLDHQQQFNGGRTHGVRFIRRPQLELYSSLFSFSTDAASSHRAHREPRSRATVQEAVQ